MRFKDKAALITGRGRGIVATAALMMLAEGGKVEVVDLNETNMKRLVKTARTRGYDLKTFVGDVSKKDSVELIIEASVKAFGRADILVNNAGIVISRPFREKTVREVLSQRILQTLSFSLPRTMPALLRDNFSLSTAVSASNNFSF